MTREEAKELLLHILMTYEPKDQYGDYDDPEPYEQALTMAIEALSSEAEPKWNCTANFVAEQLERLKDMTDEERLKLLQTMFPSTDAVMRDATAEEKASVQRYIDNISTEAVQVVRCKDCRWYEQKQKNLPYNVSKRYCNRSCVLATKENDFCSYGERRQSEKEYLDKTFPEHEGGEWLDITDMMTGESKDE